LCPVNLPNMETEYRCVIGPLQDQFELESVQYFIFQNEDGEWVTSLEDPSIPQHPLSQHFI
jgi:hypothetical protein